MLSVILNKTIQPKNSFEHSMNVLDYSKAEISRAKTADYYPGQSASGSFYANKLNPSQRMDPNLSQTQFYRGDASQQNFRIQGHPTQSYEQ